MMLARGSIRRWLEERGVVYFRRARVVCCDGSMAGEAIPVPAITVREASSDDLRQLSAAMGHGPSELPDRQKRGCVCLVARSGAETLGCVWISRSAEMMTEVRYVLDVSRDAQGAYLFDGFVLPAWRGKGILRAVLRGCRSWAAARGISRLYAAFTRENRVSERALRAMGFTAVVGDVAVLRALGRERTWVRVYQRAPLGDVLGAARPSQSGPDATQTPPRRSVLRRG